MDKGQFGRKDRLIAERRHDAYQDRKKPPEPTVCPECRALFSGGRWSWQDAPAEAHTASCPACQRIADNYPAGELEIRGKFFDLHREEIHNLIRNTEKLEKGEHPLERIMEIAPKSDHTLVTTTGIHLAQRIGEALHHAYQGEYELAYGAEEKSIRIIWTREK